MERDAEGCCGALTRPSATLSQKGEGLDLGRNQATLSQKGEGLDLRVRPFDNRQSEWVPFTDNG